MTHSTSANGTKCISATSHILYLCILVFQSCSETVRKYLLQVTLLDNVNNFTNRPSNHIFVAMQALSPVLSPMVTPSEVLTCYMVWRLPIFAIVFRRTWTCVEKFVQNVNTVMYLGICIFYTLPVTTHFDCIHQSSQLL